MAPPGGAVLQADWSVSCDCIPVHTCNLEQNLLLLLLSSLESMYEVRSESSLNKLK